MTNETYTAEQMVSGALFDFLGFLTSRDEITTFSSRHLAVPAVALLSEWAAKRGLLLDEANVAGWMDMIRQAARTMRERETPTCRLNCAKGQCKAVEHGCASECVKSKREPVKVTEEDLDVIKDVYDRIISRDYAVDAAPTCKPFADVDALRAALESFAGRVGMGVPKGWHFASGPEGHFYTAHAKEANDLLARSGFDRDEWTVTKLTTAPQFGETK